MQRPGLKNLLVSVNNSAGVSNEPIQIGERAPEEGVEEAEVRFESLPN